VCSRTARSSASAPSRHGTSTSAWWRPPTATCAKPLRARREDILPLARFFLARQAEHPLALSSAAEGRLLAHPWPGNVRELENSIERAAILARGEVLEPEDLLLEPLLEKSGAAADRGETSEVRLSDPSSVAGAARNGGGTLQDAVDRATEERVREALAQTAGRRADAARLLGVERTTLYRLMKRFEID
jgi:DNA-binding NtrC family response regulator